MFKGFYFLFLDTIENELLDQRAILGYDFRIFPDDSKRQKLHGTHKVGENERN